MENKKTVIKVHDLYKLYRLGNNAVKALDGVDFEIKAGEFCAIVGPSGSGKSTLLNMMAGLEKPTRGEVIIEGHHLEKMNENQLVKLRRERVGFIFQSFNLLPTMNAIENVALPLTFRGMAKKLRIKRAMLALDMVGLRQHMRHKPLQMSGGQQQRVGVARALVVNPAIIFADEPTGNLDSSTSAEVMALLQKVVYEHQKTLVMVTHDNQLAQFADRIFHIIDGKIFKIEEGIKKGDSNEDN
jgi:ABC-type antimicrobial peptide transport system, ATPase component